jgi:CheY-like chemotaxis protein
MSVTTIRVPSVLIVDDDVAVRQVIADYAKSVVSDVWEASNGLEALWIVKHQRPALVLLDLRLPRVDGYETIRHIRKFDPSIRIVAITGDLSDATRERVASLGIDLLHKPFDLSDLEGVLATS